MWRAALACLVLATSACGGGGGGGKATTPAPGSIDAFTAVFRAVEQWRQGWEVRSMDALAPLYRHDDHTIVVYQGQAQIGWPQAETYLRRAVDGAREIHLTLDDGRVSALGDGGATFAARLTREISDGAVTVSDAGYLTLTFARSGEAWEIVAEHYSYRTGP
ncbi:MAG: nuclear transport factor 2 family protein [Myxococcales bacterium]|nr:nuclear transport factor 2 family protein [Myxococcales bacterium]